MSAVHHPHAEIQQALSGLEVLRRQRVTLMRQAAAYVIDQCGGETTDTALYYAAMTGRTASEGKNELDPSYDAPHWLMRALYESDQTDKPVVIRSEEYAGGRPVVGVIASLSPDEYKPAILKVEPSSDKTVPTDVLDYTLWSGVYH